nr:hypothetical protein [Streptomyces rhizosphaericus]
MADPRDWVSGIQTVHEHGCKSTAPECFDDVEEYDFQGFIAWMEIVLDVADRATSHDPDQLPP